MYEQRFTASEGQTEFEVTEFTLTVGYLVFVGGILTKSGQSKSDNIVTFAVGLPEGTEVVVIN
jgi:hypothetical protein